VAKRLILLLIILFSGLAALFLSIQRGSRNILTDPYKAIPADVSVLIETVNFPGLLNSVSENNSLFKEITGIKEFEKFGEKFNFLRAIINNSEITKTIENHKTLVSFHKVDSQNLVPLMVITVPKFVRFSHIREYLTPFKDLHINVLRKGKDRFLEIVRENPEREKFYLSFVSGLVLCSKSVALIEEAILRSKSGSDLRDDTGLSRLLASVGKNEDRIFFIFNNLKDAIKEIIKSPGIAGKITNLAQGAEGVIIINDNGYLFSGYADTNDSSDILFSYKLLEPAQLNIFRQLPANTVLFETKVISGKSAGMRGEMGKSNQLLDELQPYLNGETTRAIVDLRRTGITTKATLLVYSLKNRDIAERIISDRFTIWCNENNLDENKYIRYFQPDEQTRIPVLSTPFKGIGASFFGECMVKVADSLMAFYDNYLVMSDRKEAIEMFIYDNLLHKTISTNPDFIELESTLPSKACYFFYCVPGAVIENLSEFFNDRVNKILSENSTLLKKIRCVGYQFVPSNDMIFNTLSVRYVESVESEPGGTEWESKLDGAVVTKPLFFTNHNTGAKEIVLQDDMNNLYLINAAGRILWKIQPGERVNGNIYIIDFYRNGKFQILFAGVNNLYIFDRNGNRVERFPVKLRAPASGPPALFDYDNNRDYRIFIPGEDKIIYAYDKYGNTVKGWKLFKTNGFVRSEIKFFRLSGKDFIVAADENTVYFLDRTGNIRLKPSQPVICARGSQIRSDSSGEPSFVFSAPDGTVQFIYLDGRVKKVILNKFSSEHFFDFFDIDGDGFGEFIFIDGSKLFLYDHDMTEIFIRDFGTINIKGPYNFVFSSADRKIGIFDPVKKEVFLIDKKGNDVKGFPVKGCSEFSIGSLSRGGDYNLIVGGNDNFLYNYKLNTLGNY